MVWGVDDKQVGCIGFVHIGFAAALNSMWTRVALLHGAAEGLKPQRRSIAPLPEALTGPRWYSSDSAQGLRNLLGKSRCHLWLRELTVCVEGQPRAPSSPHHVGGVGPELFPQAYL